MTLIILPVLNNEKLDKEHEEIVLFLYQLKDDKKDLPKIINKFLVYVTDHYKHEEEFMILNNYPPNKINEHIDEHTKLRILFSEKLLCNIEDMTDELLDELRGIFIEHMNKWDKLIAEWVKNEKRKRKM